MTSAFVQKLVVITGIFLLSTHSSFAIDPTKDKLEKLMEYYAVNENFNGTVLVYRKGGNLLSKGYGYQDVVKKIPNTEKTIFQVGGISMQFTAELILLLDSQGKLGLDDKVSKYLPDFPNGEKISLKQLLTHTSGLYDYTSDTTIVKDLVTPILLDSLLVQFQNKPLAFMPGEKYQFSNANYVVLGIIIDKMTRWSLEDQLRFKILGTCSMFHSGFDFTDVLDSNKAKGYYRIMKDTAIEAPITDSSITYGGCALYTTVGDLYKWHKALLTHVMLPKDWQEIAYAPYKDRIAFGWEVETMYQKKFTQQAGSVAGFSSFIIRQEGDDVFVAVLQNKVKSADSNKMIAHNIINCLYDKDYRIPAKEVIVPVVKHETPKKKDDEIVVATAKKTEPEKPVVVSPYVGEFAFDPEFSVFITIQGDDLYAQGTGQELYRLQRESNPLFYKAGVDSRIEFIKDESGELNRIMLHHHIKDEIGWRKMVTR